MELIPKLGDSTNERASFFFIIIGLYEQKEF